MNRIVFWCLVALAFPLALAWAMTPPDWDREQREFEAELDVAAEARKTADLAEIEKKKAEFHAFMDRLSVETQERIREIARERFDREPTEADIEDTYEWLKHNCP